MPLLELAQDTQHASGPTEVTLHFNQHLCQAKKGFAAFPRAGTGMCFSNSVPSLPASMAHSLGTPEATRPGGAGPAGRWHRGTAPPALGHKPGQQKAVGSQQLV